MTEQDSKIQTFIAFLCTAGVIFCAIGHIVLKLLDQVN